MLVSRHSADLKYSTCLTRTETSCVPVTISLIGSKSKQMPSSGTHLDGGGEGEYIYIVEHLQDQH